ncbi:hypothetical protein [Actinoplanes sp. NPDC049802]|uniref:hypothetical protein n=1 Tax=Actinoplanes sp. NPDC049802 TaxID=3154742 RepID=UPI0033C9C9E3
MDTPWVKVDRYDELMQTVLDAQLWFETFSHVLRADTESFATSARIRTSISSAEDFLRSILSEFETFRPTVQADQEVPLATLPVLTDYIGPYQDSEGFRRRFVHPMQEALTAMQALILSSDQP